MFSFPSLRPRVKTVPGLYTLHQGDVFLPGAGSAVFEPAFGLPAIQLIGNAIYAARSLNPLQPPQVRTTLTTTTAGLGGLVAGQLIGAPLFTPEGGNGNQ